MIFSRTARALAFLATVSTAAISTLHAQEARRSLDLTVNDVGISIGDSRRVTGMRLNFRDSRLDRVNGINITVWSPYEDGGGDIHGLAIGLPLSGARRLNGIAVGLLGFSSEQSSRGLLLGGLGVASGDNLHGIAVGGLGVASGDRIEGIAVGGLGVGAGQGGRGIVVGGLGAGMGGEFEGIVIGGLGMGTGGNMRGIGLGGLGLGIGGRATGLFFGGVGIGAGESITGISIGGIGVASPRINGIAIGGAGVGGVKLRGVMLGVATVRVREGRRTTPSTSSASMEGVAVSVYNEVHGIHKGLAIGIVNVADRLQGVQLGLINIARNNPPSRRILPVANWNFSDSGR